MTPPRSGISSSGYPHRAHWPLTLVLLLATGCGSSGANRGEDGKAGGGGSSAGPNGGGTSGTSTGGSSTGNGGSGTGTAAAGGTAANTAGGPGTGGSTGAAGSSTGDGTCRDEVSEAEWDSNCLACAGDDPCGTCACTNCAEGLRACDATPGCRDIAACVQAAGCVGVECYCGSEPVDRCASGGGNGPCKEVMLAAPGGKAPTLAAPSAGPASDALGELALCLQSSTECGAVCN